MSDKLTVTFLGTGAAVPTIRRGLPAIALSRENETFLLDCGEGTQRQIVLAGISPSKISAIFVSHLHGDHFLGIPGFVSTQQLIGRKKPLLIVGPVGIKDFLMSIIKVTSHQLDYELNFREIDPSVPNKFIKGAFTVYTCPLEHRSPNIGYRFVEKDKRGVFNSQKADALGIPEGPLRQKLADRKSIIINQKNIKPKDIIGPPVPGRVISYCTDTRPCEAAEKLAKNADLLIFDSTFGDKNQERAKVTFHSTSREAAILARESNVKKLMLWHISSRNEKGADNELLQQAHEEFAESYLSQDFDSVDILRQTGPK